MAQKAAMAKLRAATRSVSSVQNAWAAWQESARNAHFAAVMGYALPRHVGPDPSEWDIASAVAQDTDLQEQLRASSVDSQHAEALQRAICEHVQWVSSEQQRGLVQDLTDLYTDPNRSLAVAATLDPILVSHLQARDALESTDLQARNALASVESEIKPLA